MSIQDGFGDRLTPDEVMQRHSRLAGIIAREKATYDAPYDDLRQELMLTIWSLTQRDYAQHDDLRGLASVAMRRRAQEIVERQTWTGYESHRGRAIDPLRRSDRVSAEALLEEVGVEVFAAQDSLDGVEMAYHEGEIMQAICALPSKHRQYVMLRFWGGFSQPEIAEAMDTTVKTINGWWERVVKPALRTELAHLGAS